MVDTSAWVAYFRPGKSATSSRVRQLIQNYQAFLTGPVLAEMLQGVKGKKEEKDLETTFSILPFIEVQRSDWEVAGVQLLKLRQKGVTVPLTDAVIAAVARRKRLKVLTLDRHFDHLEVELDRPGS